MKNIESHQIPNINKIITGFINNHIRFHTIQLFKKSGSAAFIPEGTAVLVDFYGVFCLFTSKHIVENSFEENQLYFKIGPEEYILCTGTIEESERKSNLTISYIILDLPIAESLVTIGYKFLSNNNILSNHDPLEIPQYALVGFPKPASGQEQEITQTNGSYIISPMAPDTYYDDHIYTKEDNFIMSNAQRQDIMTGIKDKSKEL